MASDKSGGLDERLAQARDTALIDGEEIITQAMGDQGQAIVVTKSRVLIIRAGLTATGTLNGQQINVFPVDDITSVNVRKGPMGAVIQICTENKQQVTQGGPPQNVIIFTGDQRVKKCEALASKIESVLNKNVNRIPADGPQLFSVVQEVSLEPEAKVLPMETVEAVESAEPVAEVEKPAPKRRGGRKPVSLAEEMFAELAVDEPQPVQTTEAVVPEVIEVIPPAPPEPVMAVVETPVQETVMEEAIVEVVEIEPEPEPEPEPVLCFKPNPNLPKPVRLKRGNPFRMLALFGALAAMVLIGMAVTAPIREPVNEPTVEVNVSKLTQNPPMVRRQITAASDYRDQVTRLLAASNQEAVAVAKALQSGNPKAVAQASKLNSTDTAWRKLQEIDAPPGLAGAKDSIITGVFIRKNAISNAAARGAIGSSEALGRLAEGDVAIKRGTDGIAKMLTDLQNQLSEPTK